MYGLGSKGQRTGQLTHTQDRTTELGDLCLSGHHQCACPATERARCEAQPVRLAAGPRYEQGAARDPPRILVDIADDGVGVARELRRKSRKLERELPKR